MNVEKVITWNEEAGNYKGVVDYDLEIRMLNEELIETYDAMKEDDTVEIIDGLIDTIFVAIGTLHKVGLNEEQINRAFDIVLESNMTKLPFEKNEEGKIKKSENFVAPDFSEIISEINNEKA